MLTNMLFVPVVSTDGSEQRFIKAGDRRRRAEEDETVLDSHEISSVTSQDQGMSPETGLLS